MDRLGVPCPLCGSVRVVVSGRPESASAESPGGPGKAHVPEYRRCDCQECRHAFHHDFAFGR